MEPSTTMKFFYPLDLTPITLFTNRHVFATSDLPGSMINFNRDYKTRSRIESIKFLGVGMFF